MYGWVTKPKIAARASVALALTLIPPACSAGRTGNDRPAAVPEASRWRKNRES